MLLNPKRVFLSLDEEVITSEDHRKLLEYFRKLLRQISLLYENIEKAFRKFGDNILDESATWNPGSIADGDMEAKDVTVAGAALGDFVLSSFSLDISDLTLSAGVTAVDTVTCVFSNNTGAPVNLAAGTIRVKVFKR